MALTYFTVTGTFKAVISDTSTDVGGEPDIQNISSFVYFTPSADQITDATDALTYRLQPIRARTNPSDGILKNIDGTPVKLIAKTSNLKGEDGATLDELIYHVTFDHVVYNEANQVIDAFSFTAPTTATTIDLATVTRII